MKLDDYFDIVSPDEIRIRGTRIGIEAILTEYVDGKLPEEIAVGLPPLTLEQVHATITYYLSRRSEVDQYLVRWAERGNQALQTQRRSGSLLLDRLRQAKAAGGRP